MRWLGAPRGASAPPPHGHRVPPPPGGHGLRRRALALVVALVGCLGVLALPSSANISWGTRSGLSYVNYPGLAVDPGSQSAALTLDDDHQALVQVDGTQVIKGFGTGTWFTVAASDQIKPSWTGFSWNEQTRSCAATPPTGWSEEQDGQAWFTTGRLVQCENGSHAVTIEFDSPVAEPVLNLALAAYFSGSFVSYNQYEITAIDGAAVDTSRLTLDVAESSATAELTGALLTMNPTGYWPEADTANDNPFLRFWNTAVAPQAYVAVQGTVSSITIEYQQMTYFGSDSTTELTADSPLDLFDMPAASFFGYFFVAGSDLALTKSAPEVARTGESVEWTLQVENVAETAGSHGYAITDAIPDGVSDVELVSGADGCTLTGTSLVCASAPDGWALDTSAALPVLTGADPGTAVPTVLAAGTSAEPIVLRGTVTAEAGTEIVNTATVAGVDYDPDTGNNTATVTTTVVEADWTVTKSVAGASAGTYAAPGDVLTYTVQAVSSGETEVTGVTLTDDLTDVLAAADLVPGSVTLTVGSDPPTTLDDPTAASPVLTAGPVTLPAGSTATLTYRVTVRDDASSALLTNTVTAAGDSPPGTCATGAEDVCSTATRVLARLEVLKQGTVNGQVVALDGAGFEVLDDDAGSAGVVRTDLAVQAVTGSTGLLAVAGIEPGTYWLRETQAPDGHGLLADAVRFVVAEDGQVTVSDPAASTQVVAADGRLTVTDSPTFDLPTTGGAGAGRLLTLGRVLLALCVLTATALILRGRRRRETDGERSAIDS